MREPGRIFRSQFAIRPCLVRPAMLAAGVTLTTGTGVPELAGLELQARQLGIGLWADGAK